MRGQERGTTVGYRRTGQNRPHAPRGPLQQRIASGPLPSTSIGEDDIPWASITLLDGTVIAWLECHERLGKVVIGRSTLAAIRIDDQFVHRAHAEIEWDGAQRWHTITDCGGANGTYVRLQRITAPTRLTNGTRIRLGRTEMVYRRS